MLDSLKLEKAPDTVFCIPNFVTEQEEENTLRNIHKAPKPKWTNLLNRRLQNWGGLPKPKGMIAEDIPNWLQTHIDKVHQLGIFGDENTTKPNHVLINEYEPGQGISPHLDGSLFYPTIATISLGSHTVLNFYEPLSDQEMSDSCCSSLEDRLKLKIYIPRRSLILIQNQMFHHYLHGIEEIKEDSCDSNLIVPPQIDIKEVSLKRETRVSLTIRHVPNTKKIKNLFGGKF